MFTISGSYKKDDEESITCTCSYALNKFFQMGFKNNYDTTKEFWYSQINGRVTLNNYKNIANGFEESLKHIRYYDNRVINSLFERDMIELINNIKNRKIRYLIMG